MTPLRKEIIMDPVAPYYWLLMFVLFITLMRLRKIAISPKKTRPRAHRSTYLSK